MRTEKRFKGIKTTDAVGKVIDAFLNTDVATVQVEKYHVLNDALVYRSLVTEQLQIDPGKALQLFSLILSGALIPIDATLQELRQRHAGRPEDVMRFQVRRLAENVIAMRIRLADDSVQYVGNSSALPLIGRRVAFGREQVNRDETEVQARLSKLIPMVPFSVFQQARLDLNSMRIIERGPAETVTRKVESVWTDCKTGKPKYKLETVHFTGASLFAVGGSAFLFDIDRREIEEQVFNPFLAKLPSVVGSIAEAYESLKPQAVKDAEAIGVPYRRQGEWFFLPVPSEQAALFDAVAGQPGALRPITLKAGPNRPNTCETGLSVYNGEVVMLARGDRRDDWQDVQAGAVSYVKGAVKHTGREHADLVLDGWYMPVPNTATESFTILGDID